MKTYWLGNVIPIPVIWEEKQNGNCWGWGAFASVFSKSSQEVLWVVEEGGYKQV